MDMPTDRTGPAFFSRFSAKPRQRGFHPRAACRLGAVALVEPLEVIRQALVGVLLQTLLLADFPYD
jgi:hypothetical protein